MKTTETKNTNSITGNGLIDTIMVNYDALDWTIGFCRKVRAGISRNDIEGWLLCSGYMEVLGIDSIGIVRDLSGAINQSTWGDTLSLDFWRRAIMGVGCRGSNGRLEFRRPEKLLVESMTVEQFLFVPNPAMIPYSEIIETMKREGKSRGYRLRDLLFQYNGKIIRSAGALADMILNRDMEVRPVCHALDRWRDNLMNCILRNESTKECANAANSPTQMDDDNSLESETDNDFYTPESLHGQMVSGAQLAKYLGRTSKTLRRWDKLGMVPTGKKWIPGMKVSGNVILYELSENWPAIQSMMQRERDGQTDKQLAYELRELAIDERNQSA